MTTRFVWILGIGSLSGVSLSGCAGAQTSRSTLPSGPTRPAGARTFTDSDTVTSVAATRSEVFVATLRGVLRFAPDGTGEPTRHTTAQGLPDDQSFAISVSPDGITWVATARGVARLMGDRWTTVGGTQPDVGRPTALLALGSGQVLLGGAQGLARYDGIRWMRMTDRYQVMAFAPQQGGGVLVATVQTGVVALREDFSGADEYGPASGAPDALARSVVGVGSGRFWALLQGPSGARLGYFDGHRWFGYTHATARSNWVALVPSRAGAGAALVTRDGVFDIVADGGVSLAATDAGPADGRQRVTFRSEALDSPPSLPSAPPASRTGAGAAGTSPASGAAAVPSTGRTGGAGATDDPVRESAPPPRNVPAHGPPVELPAAGGALAVQAPRYGLAPAPDAARAARAGDLAGAFADASGVTFVAHEGRGVSRFGGGAAADFATRDLALARRPLSVASDGSGGVWVATDQGVALRFDGQRFVPRAVDPRPDVVPLLFWSRAGVAAAVARQGANNLVAYRFAEGAWQVVTTRRIDPGSPGTIDARFLSVDGQNRFWVGLRVVEANGTIHERGVVLLDGNLPRPTYFRALPRRGRGPHGLVVGPDDVSAIDFDSQNQAWLAGVSGATLVGPGRTPRERATVRSFAEAQGVRGDVVSDLVRGPSGHIWFVTPESVGYHDGTAFHFGVDGAAELPRATAVAADSSGVLWGVGPRGGWRYDGTRFHRLGREDGLPEGRLGDIAVDGESRLWIASEAGLTVIDRLGVGASGVDSGGESGASSGAAEGADTSLSGL